jgi:hypothetical protein
MTSAAAFVDLEGLRAIVQANAGPLVPVTWSGTSPDPWYGNSGLDGNGNPQASGPDASGVEVATPSGAPAPAPVGWGAGMKIEIDVTDSEDSGQDEVRRVFQPSASTTTTGAQRGDQLTINVASTTGFPPFGQVSIVTDQGTIPVSYSSVTDTAIKGCRGGFGNIAPGAAVVCAERFVLLKCGIRKFTLSILVSSDDFPAAITTCERLRRRFARRSTFEALNALGCAFIDAGKTQPVTVPNWNGRAVDAVLIEITLSYAMNEVDEVGEGPDGNGNWIEASDPVIPHVTP